MFSVVINHKIFLSHSITMLLVSYSDSYYLEEEESLVPTISACNKFPRLVVAPLMMDWVYRILSKISDTLIVRTSKYVVFHVLIAPDTEISRDFPLSNYNRTVLRVRVHVRTCRAPSAKLLSVFVLPSAPTRSCQGRDENVLHEFVVVFVYHLYSVGGILMDTWLWGYLQARPLTRPASRSPLWQRFCSSPFSGRLPCGY